jgi:hypothetical protein
MAASACSGKAACNPQIDRVDAPRNDPYDPFSPNVSIFSLDVNIRNRGDSPCDLRFVALSESAGQRQLEGSSSRALLQYDLIAENSVRLPNEAATSFAFPLQIPANGKQVVRLQMRINPGRVVPSGHFHDHLRLRLVDPAGSQVTNERRLPVSVRVQPRAQVNMAGSSSNFSAGVRSANLDLGELSRGATGRVSIQVRSNEPVRIRIESSNRGQLRHIAEPTSVIPYHLSVDGSRIDLSNSVTLSRKPAMSLDGSAYEAIARVDPVSGAVAGEYRDLITISVDADG